MNCSEARRRHSSKATAPLIGNQLLTLREVADVLRLHPRTVRQYVQRGEIKGRIIFHLDSLPREILKWLAIGAFASALELGQRWGSLLIDNFFGDNGFNPAELPLPEKVNDARRKRRTLATALRASCKGARLREIDGTRERDQRAFGKETEPFNPRSPIR
jgi:hypothetical protein